MKKSQQATRLITTVLILLSLAGLGLVIYGQTVSHHFLSFDDDTYITGNPLLHNGFSITSLWWIFSSYYASNWHPVTWLSHLIDIQLFGLIPSKHHLVNVFWHIVNSMLVFALFKQLTKKAWHSYLVAALFVCHPLHVESVAWVSERKDLLCGFFWLLSLLSYHYYLQKPLIRRYAILLFCFVAGLMSKPMLVTLPFCLLLLDHWPYNRWLSKKESLWQLFKEKTPLFFLSFLSCLITYNAQQHGNSLVSITNYQLIERVSNATISYVGYLNKTVWPVRLAVFYPYPESIQIFEGAASLFLLVLISYFSLINVKKRPYLAVGWLWYLGTLLPVIGLVQVGEQAMADRYTYIPLLGIFIILVWGIEELISQSKTWRNKEKYITISAILALTVCTVLSFQQAGYWKNNIELFSHALEVTENNYLAHFQLGTAYAKKGDLPLAKQHLKETIRQKPGTAQAYNNLAYVLERQGNIGKAITNYQKSVTLDPENQEALYNLGIIYLRRWELKKAIHHFQKVVELNPKNQLARKNLAKAKKLLANQKR